MDSFKAFGWSARFDNREQGRTRVGGVDTDCPIELKAHIAALQSHIIVLEQDRIADACQIDRMAIQVQILRVDAARHETEIAALRSLVNGDKD